MRILLLTHRLPFPPNKGDKIRSFHLLAHLARRHEVYLACLVDDEQDLAHITEVTRRVRGFAHGVIGGRLRKLLSSASLLQGRSVTVNYFYCARLQRQIDAWIDSLSFDCCFCFSSPMAEYLFRSVHAAGKLLDTVRVMDLIDVDSYKWRQYARRAPFWSAWVYWLEARNLSAYERRIARSFDHLFVVSEQERSHFPDSAAAGSLRALANGVDLDFFTSAYVPVRQIAGRPLVFTGVMDYWPNVEGMIWFVERILPRVRQRVPGTQLYIVGSRPTPAVRKLARIPDITVTGFVADTRDYLAAASVCVVPLRIARGIQNKILEAMAMGKPVVTTRQAFEGVRAVAGEEIVVADGEENFARATVNLLLDPAVAGRIGARARGCVERHYSWDANLGELAQIGL